MTALQDPRRPHDLTPAEPTEHGQSSDGAASITAELASVRRRMTTAEPGTTHALRARQKILLHQILANRRSSDFHHSTGDKK